MNTICATTSVNTYQTVCAQNTSRTEKTLEKPIWNPNRVYRYLEDMNAGFQSYKKEAVSYYESLIAQKEGDGTMTVEELKAQIAEYFPEYTLTDREPSEVRDGVFSLYIDEKNLQKMATDPDYRARVYGLMDCELQGAKGYTLQYSDGRNVTAHLTGTIFSLSEKNKKYAGADGIPYLGSCKSDQCFSSSDSHPQVRSMSYLYDHLDPARSAAKDRKTNAAKVTAERLAKKRKKKAEEKKKQERIQEKRQRKEQIEEKRQENLQERIAQMKSGARYKEAADIQISSETYGGSVTFPEGKRMAQISSAMTNSDLQTVMELLARDLSDCEAGVKNGLCDETEVQKVQAVIKAAEEKQRQLEKMQE